MFEFIKKLFSREKVDFVELKQQGAVIIDVRSEGEYRSGHGKSAVNIPLNQLGQGLSKYKDKEKAYIVVCASGMRSGSARSIMLQKGYTKVYNAGSWMNVRNL